MTIASSRRKRKLTAVAFDLSGVLTTPPFAGLHLYEDAVGLPREALVQYFRGELAAQVELGVLSGRQFWEVVTANVERDQGIRINEQVAIATAEAEWAFNPEAIQLLHDLEGHYALALVTNNAAEATHWRDQLDTTLFDVLIDSSAVGLRKPDPRIYRLLLERLDRPAAEVVFVDDNVENLLPAAALGIQTILFQSVDQVRRALAELGVPAGGSAGPDGRSGEP